jgi:hypothetical protein
MGYSSQKSARLAGGQRIPSAMVCQWRPQNTERTRIGARQWVPFVANQWFRDRLPEGSCNETRRLSGLKTGAILRPPAASRRRGVKPACTQSSALSEISSPRQGVGGNAGDLAPAGPRTVRTATAPSPCCASCSLGRRPVRARSLTVAKDVSNPVKPLRSAREPRGTNLRSPDVRNRSASFAAPQRLRRLAWRQSTPVPVCIARVIPWRQRSAVTS